MQYDTRTRYNPFVSDEAQKEFLERLMRLVAGAIKQVRQTHGDPVDAGSVAKRVAADMWARTKPAPHKDDAAWVRYVRGQLGWTQTQLAEAVGVSRLTITRWESGAQTPRGKSRERLEKLAQQ